MATYYVSPYGSDANNGLGPDPTNATNKPFATLSKAIGFSGAASAGDTVYLAPGVYRYTGTYGVITGVSGSSGNPINVLGDPGNTRGFKDGSGNLISAGEVRFTNAGTNDTTAPTTGSGVSLQINNSSYLNISNIWFIGQNSSGAAVIQLSGTAHDVNFTQCMFQTGYCSITNQPVITIQPSTAQALNVTFDRCIVLASNSYGMLISPPKNSSADYSLNVNITNSLFLGGAWHVRVASSGSGSFLGGGVTAKNCSFLFAASTSVITADAGVSTTYPVGVYNSVFYNSSGNSFSANTAGQIVEDYNLFGGSTNMAAVNHSKADGSCAVLMDVGQWSLWGQNPKPFGTPTVGSPLLGFGNAAGAPGSDFLSRLRPEGGNSLSNGIGYLERHDTAAMETVITDSGGVGIRIDGPGSHEFQIPVDATATTITVKCQYDANHGTTTPPQAILVAAPEIGVSGQTITAPAVAGQWSTLAFSPITPTARGVVRVQLVSHPASANGKAYFDTFAIS